MAPQINSHGFLSIRYYRYAYTSNMKFIRQISSTNNFCKCKQFIRQKLLAFEMDNFTSEIIKFMICLFPQILLNNWFFFFFNLHNHTFVYKLYPCITHVMAIIMIENCKLHISLPTNPILSQPLNKNILMASTYQ